MDTSKEMGKREVDATGIVPDAETPSFRINGILPHCIATALYRDAPPLWELTVKFVQGAVIYPDSCVCVSICEVDKSRNEPILEDASPQIFNVVCFKDKVVIRGKTDSDNSLNLMLNIIVHNRKKA
ncbi:MAG: hypothetical protein WAM14_23275 [Candidatus Nitrosopolaris sp.]